MPRSVGGECSRCGECCKPPVMVDNPCMKRGDPHCLFYEERVADSVYGHCRFKSGDASNATEKQRQWYLNNCIDYPRVQDFGGKMVLAQCTYYLVGDG